MVEVKVGDDIIFVEKKFISLGASALDKSTEVAKNEPVAQTTDDQVVKTDVTVTEEDETSVETSHDDNDDEDEDDDDEEDDNETEEVEVVISDDAPVAKTSPVTPDLDMLRAKLKKSLQELEDIKSDMKMTFTSTDTISTTIQSLKGMIDALKKDQMNILSRR